MTQKSIAKECTEWIKEKVIFKSNTTNENMAGFMNIENKDKKITYMPIQGFTTVDIGCERGNNFYNMINKIDAPYSEAYLTLFENIWQDKDKLQDVTDIVIDSISNAYKENPPELIYFITLYNVFSEFLEDISEDILPNEATGFKDSKIWNLLYDFQQDAVLAIINKLEKYNGCILADSVGLGKTFTALAVIKYYENRNKSVLVLCPKKLAELGSGLGSAMLIKELSGTMNIYPKYIPKLIITVIDKIIRKKVVVVADNSPNASIPAEPTIRQVTIILGTLSVKIAPSVSNEPLS